MICNDVLEGGLESFQQQVNTFRAQDEQRHDCLEKLVMALSDVRTRCNVLEGDKESEQNSRRQLQQRVRELENNLGDLRKRVTKSAFVLVLLDADHDGYVFKDEYINAGAEGGKAAAQDFQKHIRSSLVNLKEIDENIPFMVRAFANVEGLHEPLRDAGIDRAPEKMERFIKGFNRVQFCDFVSVGYGKDRADEKIKAIFSHACSNPSCVDVVLGACHDNGYVRMLEQIHEPEVQARITLLESIQTGCEFATLPMQRIEVNGLFRTELMKSVTPVQAAGSVTPDSVNDTNLAIETYANKVKANNGTESPSQPSLGGSSGCVVRVNSAGLRLDEALPPCVPKARQSYRQKLNQGLRFCKTYFLASQCEHGFCAFKHEGLSDEEIQVCRVEMRRKPCNAGGRCRKRSCFYGHHCPQKGCSGDSCNFGFPVQMHHVLLQTD